MSDPRKVLWLIKGLGIGGAERLLVDALPYVDRKSYEYEVAYFLPGKRELVSEIERAGVPVHCLNLGGPFDAGAVIRLRKLIKGRHFDIVHAHLPFAGLMGRLATRMKKNCAMVYTEHNVLGAYNPAMRTADRLTYWMDDSTIAVSEGVANSIRTSRVFKPRRLVTIENGINMEVPEAGRTTGRPLMRTLGLPDGALIVGNVAHIRPEKGHSHLINAFARVAKQVPNAYCVVVGGEKTPGVQAALESQAASLGIRDRVVFAGFRTDARLLAAEFDVFTLSSLHEGLPIALLEAMLLEKPSVTTAVGGIPEVIEDGVEGFMVKPRDPDALAEGLVKLLKDASLRSRMGAAARTKATLRFGVARMVREVEAVYAQVLNGQASVVHKRKEAA